MSSYGQVYHGLYADGLGWRGILMDADHWEVWIGLRTNTPEEAFAAMREEAPVWGVVDLRPWHASAEERAERAERVARRRGAA